MGLAEWIEHHLLMLEAQGLNPALSENSTSLPQSPRGSLRSPAHHQISESSEGGGVKPKKWPFIIPIVVQLQATRELNCSPDYKLGKDPEMRMLVSKYFTNLNRESIPYTYLMRVQNPQQDKKCLQKKQGSNVLVHYIIQQSYSTRQKYTKQSAGNKALFYSHLCPE